MSKKINLVQNGIFPITKDKDGKDLNDTLDTGFSVAGTVQGEGVLTGVPCLFIRTSGCNLRCYFRDELGGATPCDTSYSSHYAETNMTEIQDIVDVVKHNIGNMKHIVISGGEPLLQGDLLAELIVELRKQVRSDLHFTVETNGTIFNKKLAEQVSLWSISPKLKTSNPTEEAVRLGGDPKIKYNAKWEARHEKERKNIEAIQSYINHYGEYDETDLGYVQLKFVVSNPNDIDEIKNDFISKLTGIENENILLMPEGITAEDLALRSKWVVELCVQEGYRFCPRIHCILFGKARRV